MVDESTANVLSDAEKKIVQQIEYYFGDVNFPKDKFLTEQAGKDDGWVPVQTLLTFNRLKSLSTDVHFVAETVKKSFSELVEINEDSTKIRRRTDKPLPENRLEFWKQLKTRTVYVKGFPLDITIDQLVEFFSKFGKVDTLLMRRLKDAERTFKGSVFVTFENRDLCQKFLKEESVKYNDVELIKMFESDYYTKKAEERKQSKMQKQKENLAARAQQKKDVKKEKENEAAKNFVTGLVIHLSGFPEESTIDRDAIRALFQKFGQVEWIDFNRGDKQAFVRVKGEEKAAEPVLSKCKEANGGKMMLCEKYECEACILTGEKESEYWRNTAQAKKQALQRKSDQNKGNRHKGKGGRRRGSDRKNAKPDADSKAENGKAESAAKRPLEDADETAEVVAKAPKVE